MKFLYPVWLWLILILPLIYGGVYWDEKRKRIQFERFANQKMWDSIIPEFHLKSRIRKAGVLLSALAFTFIALARPQWGTREEMLKVSGLDIVFVLDVSHSMEVEDVVPSRLQKAKHVIRSLIQKLEGDRAGVVAFAGSSYMPCPLTTDLTYVSDTVQMMGPKMIPNQGTDIGTAIDTALKALERGGEERLTENGAKDTEGAPGEADQASHVVILISDGEDHEKQIDSNLEKIKKSGVKFYILGVGTEKGGPIPIKDSSGNAQGYKKDKAGETVISTFHPGALKQIAQAAGARYWDVTPDEMEVGDLLRDLSGLQRSDYSERRYIVYEDLFQIPLAIAIILLLLEISIPTKKMNLKQNSSFFAFILLSLLSALTGVKTIHAAERVTAATTGGSQSTSLDSYFKNEKGIRAYEAGKIEEAQKDFGAAQARDPSLPELQFNQGVVQMKQGEVDSAIDAFQESARMAEEKRNSSLAGKSLFNLGNAHTKKGHLKDAIQSYVGAIRKAKEAGDQDLEDASRKNLQLLQEEKKKQQEQKKEQEQKQQQEEQKKQQDEQQQKQQDQQQPKENEEQKKQDEQNSQKKKDEQQSSGSQSNQKKQESQEGKESQQRGPSRGQKFESKKMTKEDADRVMLELQNRERALQEKLQNANTKQQNNLKDW